MSFIYCKSQEYIYDTNGNAITENIGSKPYRWTNQFKNPLVVKPTSTIELVSADINIENQFSISAESKSDSITWIYGSQSAGFLQKVSKLKSGSYSTNGLLDTLQTGMNDASLLDCGNWKWGDTADGKITMAWDNTISKKDFTENGDKIPQFYNYDNKWDLFQSKVGYDETDSNLDDGIGTSLNEVSLTEQSSDDYGSLLVKSSKVEADWVDGTNLTQPPPTLISNVITPKNDTAGKVYGYGINQQGGITSQIVKPLEYYKFDTAGIVSDGIKFTQKVNTATQSGDFVAGAYSGANGYDFQLVNSTLGKTYYCKILQSASDYTSKTWSSTNINGNWGWGFVMVASQMDSAIGNDLNTGNEVCMMLGSLDGGKTAITKWEMIGGSTPSTQISFTAKDSAEITKLQARISVDKQGCYGSFGVGLTRGETGLVGEHQGTITGTGARNTRVYVDNVSGGVGYVSSNDVYNCDYSCMIAPTEDLSDCRIRVSYINQTADKLPSTAETWNTQTTTSYDLKTSLPSIDITKDNLCLIANMVNYTCVSFSISHDTAGDMKFINETLLASTIKEYSPATDLPMNFCEMSYPIIPVHFCSNGWASDLNDNLVVGRYSHNKITKSLASLYAKMETDWGTGVYSGTGVNYTDGKIPSRQYFNIDRSITDTCIHANLKNYTLPLKPLGFSGQTEGSLEVGDGGINWEMGHANGGETNVVVRLADLRQDEFTEISNMVLANNGESSGYTRVPPNRISRLNRMVGFPKYVVAYGNEWIDPDDPDGDELDSYREKSWTGLLLPDPNLSDNFIVNLENFGNIKGQNAFSNSVSQIAGVIPEKELEGEFAEKHYRANYPLPVKINVPAETKINNFNVSIVRDNNSPAELLKHPTSLVFRLVE